MGQGILLFDTNGSGSAGTNSSFDQDAFNDISVAATNNAGLTSTVSTNPLNQYFANDNVPRYGVKTLWIKDLVAITDRTLWINDLPTYQVVWNEEFPAAKGYVYGTVSLNVLPNGTRVDLNRVGDGFGVGGVIRRVQWIVETQTTATTAQLYTDGAATSTVTLTGKTGWDGQPKFNCQNHEAGNETYNLHDYRLQALSASSLQVTGCVVYYEIPGLGVDQAGGDSYLNKTQVIANSATYSLPSLNNVRGGRTVIAKTLSGGFTTISQPITDVVSVATGSINTNLLSLTTGTGQSFPPGTAVYIPNGATYYIGNVLSQSSDSLTMGVTLPFGVSNNIYQLFQAGHTAFPVGRTLFTESYEYVTATAFGSSNVVGVPYYFQDPILRYRLWTQGSNIQATPGNSFFASMGASFGLELLTSGTFFQFDGEFQALEFEFMAGQSAVLQATLVIDGLGMYNFNDNINNPGFFRKYIMTNAGPGWHQVQFTRGAGQTQILLSKVIGYKSYVPNGPSFGVLAEIRTGQTFLPQSTISATTTALGAVRRIYADSLPFTGNWVRQAPGAVTSGGIAFAGTTTNCALNFSFYGSAFAINGRATGTSLGITVDGVGTSGLVNTWLNLGASNTFHNVAISLIGASALISAVDILKPQGEIAWKNNLALPSDPRFFELSNGALSLKRNSITAREIQLQGIQTQNIGNNQITSQLIGANQVLRSNLVAVGNQTSAGSGAFTTTSGTFVPVTNLSLTFNTSGRPVALFLQGNTTTSCLAGGNSGIITVTNNGVSIFTYEIDALQFPVLFLGIDTTVVGIPGAYTYVVLVQTTGGSFKVTNLALVGYEL